MHVHLFLLVEHCSQPPDFVFGRCHFYNLGCSLIAVTVLLVLQSDERRHARLPLQQPQMSVSHAPLQSTSLLLRLTPRHVQGNQFSLHGCHCPLELQELALDLKHTQLLM